MLKDAVENKMPFQPKRKICKIQTGPALLNLNLPNRTKIAESREEKRFAGDYPKESVPSLALACLSPYTLFLYLRDILCI